MTNDEFDISLPIKDHLGNDIESPEHKVDVIYDVDHKTGKLTKSKNQKVFKCQMKPI